MRFPRPGVVVLLSALIVNVGSARAAATQDNPVPVASAPSDPWQERYQAARQQMFDGHFAAAATAFTELASAAPDETAQRLASEQADMCGRWARGGFVLRPPFEDAAFASAHNAELRLDRRTTDELAVLYATAVLYGVGSGVVLAIHTDPGSNAAFILPMLGFAAASAGLVAVLDNKWTLRYGVAQSIVSGLFIGLEEALAWTIWHEASASYQDEWSGETLSSIFWASATAGAVAGGIYGSVYGTTPGRASFMGSAAVWTATVAGLAVGSIAGNEQKADEYAMLTAAFALNGGAVAGALLGSQVSPSIARVRFLDLGALAGGLLFGGLYLAMDDGNSDDGRGLMAVAATGITAGLASAWYLTRGMAPDPLRGNGRSPDVAALTPMIAPTPDGRGMLLGLGGTL